MFEPLHPRAQLLTLVKAQQPFANGDPNVIGIERTFDRKQPFTLLVAFADANRLVRLAIQLLAQLHLDQ